MIYLARHGRTAYNLEGRFQGQGDVPLDDQGRRDAATLAELAAQHGFAALWASPLPRARETAEIVSTRLGLPVREDARLAETDTGEWTDRLFAEVQAELPDRFAGWVEGHPEFAFPGGESFREQGDRVMAAIAEIERGPLPALVVCHGMTIRVALGRRAGTAGPVAQHLENGALVALDGR
jgi:broad specificity phosphatase PhoE